MKLRRGSLSIEYACLLAIVIAGLIGMSVYFTRALCSRWRGVGDGFGFGRQYELEITDRRRLHADTERFSNRRITGRLGSLLGENPRLRDFFRGHIQNR